MPVCSFNPPLIEILLGSRYSCNKLGRQISTAAPSQIHSVARKCGKRLLTSKKYSRQQEILGCRREVTVAQLEIWDNLLALEECLWDLPNLHRRVTIYIFNFISALQQAVLFLNKIPKSQYSAPYPSAICRILNKIFPQVETPQPT